MLFLSPATSIERRPRLYNKSIKKNSDQSFYQVLLGRKLQLDPEPSLAWIWNPASSNSHWNSYQAKFFQLELLPWHVYYQQLTI